MTEQDIEALKELAEKATPGPWSAKYIGTAYPLDRYVYKPEFLRQPGKSMVVARCDAHVHTDEPPYRDNPDAHYIAAANPQTVLALIDALSQLQSENAALRAKLQAIESGEQRKAETND